MVEENRRIQLSVPAQGIEEDLSLDDAVAFFDKETTFYNRLQKITNTQFIFANTNYGDVSLARNATRALTQIKNELASGKLAPIEEYLQNARQLRVLIGQGTIGRKVDALLSAAQPFEAKWITYITSPVWLDLNNERGSDVFTALRAALTANPATDGFVNVASTEQALRTAEDALDRSSKLAAEMELFRQEKNSLFSNLEDLYRRKLVLDEPALLWKTIAASKAKSWRAWLFVFALLVIAPIAIGVSYHEAILGMLEKLTVNANGTISVAGVAAVTVPALFYAWLLKNISRVFIQSLNLADDAAHRRALALTYLGLAANPKLNVAEQDRALILNALFRPIPTQTADEGPPSGLLELIRKKD